MAPNNPNNNDRCDRLVVSLRRASRDLLAKRSIRDLDQALAQIVLAAVATVPASTPVAC